MNSLEIGSRIVSRWAGLCNMSIMMNSVIVQKKKEMCRIEYSICMYLLLYILFLCLFSQREIL